MTKHPRIPFGEMKEEQKNCFQKIPKTNVGNKNKNKQKKRKEKK